MKIEIDDIILNELGYFYIEKHSNNEFILYNKYDDFIGISYLNGRLFQVCQQYYIYKHRDKLINDILNNK